MKLEDMAQPAQETHRAFAARFDSADNIQEYLAQNNEGIEGQKQLLDGLETSKTAYENIQGDIDTLSDAQTFQPYSCLMETYGHAAWQQKVYGRQMAQIQKQIADLEASNTALYARLKELDPNG